MNQSLGPSEPEKPQDNTAEDSTEPTPDNHRADLSELRGIPKKQTGIEGFEDISHGGLPLGRTTLVSGTSGTGKTLFAMQFLYNGIVKYQEPGIFVTFEETPADIIRNASSFGWDLQALIDRGQLFILDASPDPEGYEVSGNFDLSALIERIQYAIRKYKAKRVSIDSVTAIFQQYDPAGVVRRELFRLTARLKQANVTTVMTTERTDEYGPIARYGVEEFVSDNVVILRNILEGEKRRRTIEILKLRGTTHMKGEYPFTITNDGINIFPLGAMQLTQRSSNVRVSSGIEKLDEMCGGGFFKDSIILATGATGTGKTSLVSKFLERGCLDGERCILFAYEESRAQLSRNASSWGIDLEEFERQGLLKIICAYPESAGLEDHLQKIKTEMMAFKPSRMAIDSLSALARGGEPKCLPPVCNRGNWPGQAGGDHRLFHQHHRPIHGIPFHHRIPYFHHHRHDYPAAIRGDPRRNGPRPQRLQNAGILARQRDPRVPDLQCGHPNPRFLPGLRAHHQRIPDPHQCG